MSDIAINSAKNGGPTSVDILTALQATNDDLDIQHKETADWHKEVIMLFTAHCKEAEVRDRRIANLEIKFEDPRYQCRQLVEGIANDSHDTLGDEQFQSKLVWFFASTFGKFVLVLAGLLAGMLLNVAIYGRP